MAYDPYTPWSWAPDAWQQGLGQPAPLQPGQVMPEAGAYMPVPLSPPVHAPEIEMPEDVLTAPAPAPFIGFPTNPDESLPPELPVELEHESTAPALYAVPDLPPEPEPQQRQGMQPGLGIPAHLIDQAVIGAHQEGYQPLPPEPTGDIEMEQDPLTEGDRSQSLEDMDSPDFAAFAAEHEEERRQSTAAKLARAATEDARRAEDERRIFVESRNHARDARQAVEVEAAELAEAEDETWMESLGPGQKIAAFVAAIVGGLVAGRTGGRNDGMAMIERENERYVAAQTAKRANARQMINDKRAAANEQIQDAEGDYRAESAFRAAAWERTVRGIEAEQANYDPNGTSAIRLEAVRREAVGKQQAALAAYEEREIKRMEAEGKSKLEIAKFVQKSRDDEAQRIETARHNKQAERASLTSAGASYLTAKTGAKKAEAEIAAAKLENTLRSPAYFKASGLAEPPHEMTEKQYKAWLENKSKAADVVREGAVGVVKSAEARLESSGPGGSPYAVSDQEGKPILRKDGSILEIKDSTERRRASDVMTAAKNVRRIADIVKIMRADKGGASSAVGSPEYQELQSLASQIDFETFVGYGLGAPSEGDKALAEGVRGGKSITSFVHDPSSGFEAYAKGIEEKANAELRKHGEVPYVEFKRAEAVQAIERTQLQNMDAWSPPELLDSSVDPAIRKRAAARAVESADALAKQSAPHLVVQFAKENESRLAEGLINEKQAGKARDVFRKVYGRRVREAMRTKDGDALAELGVGAEAYGLGVDVDALLGIKKGKK